MAHKFLADNQSNLFPSKKLFLFGCCVWSETLIGCFKQMLVSRLITDVFLLTKWSPEKMKKSQDLSFFTSENCIF